MDFLKRLKPDNLTKILFALFFVLSGVAVFLFIQISNKNLDSSDSIVISPVKAQDRACIDSEYAKCCQRKNGGAADSDPKGQPGTGGFCNASDAASCQGEATAQCAPVQTDGEYPAGTNCRVREKVGCAAAEFKRETLSKLTQPYQMLYCNSISNTKINGWYYGNAEAKGGVNDKFGSCGNDNLCNDGNYYGLQDHGKGTACGNPFRCPEAPAQPTPSPTPTNPGSTPTPTNPPGRTPTPTPTSTPTPTPVPAKCEYAKILGAGNAKTRVIKPGESVIVEMQVSNPDVKNNAAYLNVYNKNNGSNIAGIPTKDADRNTAGQPINSALVLASNAGHSGLKGFITPGDNAAPVRTFKWAVTYDKLFGTATTPVIDTNTNQPLTYAQLNGIGGGLTNYDGDCVVYLQKVARTVQSPNIEITKTLVSQNFQKVGNNIVFNLTVRNTGDADIRNFTLSDNFDPSYLQFISSTYRNTVINPSSTTTENSRTKLTWNNMPPKSNQVQNEDGVLKTGETMNLTVTFKILRATTPELLQQNENCGVISTIEYVDDLGQTQQQTLNPVRQDCVEFDTPTETPITVIVDKTTLTPSVVSPNEVKFKATIKNNDSEQRTYNDIDFTDEYDTKYLKPLRVIVTNPAGRTSTVNNFANTGVLKINNLQDLKDSANVALGSLLFNQTYTLEIVYVPVAPIDSTCDTVFADVKNGNNGGTSNRDTACAKITPPPPPNTGANEVLNLVLPGLGMIIAGAANIVMRRKVI